MKRLGCFLLVMGVLATGMLGLVYYLFITVPDQSHLTLEVDVAVTEADSVGSSTRSGADSDYRIYYRYRIEDQWFADDDLVGDQYWQPGDPLQVCVDPDQPADHVLRDTPDDQCGDETVNMGINTATPTTAPD